MICVVQVQIGSNRWFHMACNPILGLNTVVWWVENYIHYHLQAIVPYVQWEKPFFPATCSIEHQ